MLLFYYALECIGLKDLASTAKKILTRIHHIKFESVDNDNEDNDENKKEDKVDGEDNDEHCESKDVPNDENGQQQQSKEVEE